MYTSTKYSNYFKLQTVEQRVNNELNSCLEVILNPSHAYKGQSVSPCINNIKNDLSLADSGANSLSDVISLVRRNIVTNSIHLRHKDSLAHMVPPPASISIIADLLIGAMNQCAFIREEAPMANIIEQEVISWMNRLVGYSEKSSGILTSGGTMSNFLAIYLALQYFKKTKKLPLKRFKIIASDQAHLSLEKGAALAGLDKRSIVRVKSDSLGNVSANVFIQACEKLLVRGFQPAMLFCTAGTTNTGSLEPIKELWELSQRYQSWFHIDAAHGGSVTLLPRYKRYTDLWKNAHSISWDPHKTLYVSYAVGALLVKEKEFLKSLKFTGDYALKADEVDDPGEYHFEGSRRFEALKIWMTIKQFGYKAFSEIIEKTFSLAKTFSQQINHDKCFELMNRVDTNIVCFRYFNDNISLDSINMINQEIQKRLYRLGGPLLSATMLHNTAALRTVIYNPEYEASDFISILNKIKIVGNEVSNQMDSRLGNFTKKREQKESKVKNEIKKST